MTSTRQLPNGFRFAGVKAGIKESGQRDLALITGELGQFLTAAGVYTENLVRAASIDWNRAITPGNKIAGLVINAGNANACTGPQGTTDNHAIAQQLANNLDSSAEQVLVLSTGVIGVHLPMPKLLAGIDNANGQLDSASEQFAAASEAILTTDKTTKTVSQSGQVGGREFQIAGICKGAGMIGPRMATLLGVIMTDLQLTPEQAQLAIKQAVDLSFNRISVDGHMSTNDAILLLSSGRVTGPDNAHEWSNFHQHLNDCCIELAKMIPNDGEGASHLIEITVTGAQNNADAERIARSIASSNLVKTAITGADPNWGRIVSAAGYAGAKIDVAHISLKLNGHPVFHEGQPVPFDEQLVSDSLNSQRQTAIELIVGEDPGQATHWTSDLTCEYVRINSEYRT